MTLEQMAEISDRYREAQRLDTERESLARQLRHVDLCDRATEVRGFPHHKPGLVLNCYGASSEVQLPDIELLKSFLQSQIDYLGRQYEGLINEPT